MESTTSPDGTCVIIVITEHGTTGEDLQAKSHRHLRDAAREFNIFLLGHVQYLGCGCACLDGWIIGMEVLYGAEGSSWG